MFEQALELRVERLVVFDAVQVMALRHPLDVQNRQRHGQRIVRQHGLSDGFRRADYSAFVAEAALKLFTEAFEEVDVFGLFARELQQRAHAIIVAMKLRAGVIQHERQDELFHQTEDAQVSGASYLIERALFVCAQKAQRLHARQRFRHKRFREIEPLVVADDVFDAPVDLLGVGQRRSIRVAALAVFGHFLAPFIGLLPGDRLRLLRIAIVLICFTGSDHFSFSFNQQNFSNEGIAS
ncbi:MAG: hypothetical protein JMDDDDMK_03003 [Acidobacteria bacterium]|nr:hypothetical protein [Acidobacteriota bacterium]